MTLHEQSTNPDLDLFSCADCPYGANCPGNALIARPNFWGEWKSGQVSFKQCPNYCCTGTDEASCSSYDSCAGNRTGTLCGACQTGFSVSILSGQCVPNFECGHPWFWALATLAALLYMIWYTFKDEIIQIPINLFLRIRRKMTANNKNSEKSLDKGYFGIVVFFIQSAAVMKVELDITGNDKSNESFLNKLHSKISDFLNIDPSQVSYSLCPFVGLDATGKMIYKFIFLWGIYFCWFVFISLVHICQCASKGQQLSAFKSKLVAGFIEIVKYTYSGLAQITFLSLTCIKLSTVYVWQLDGTVKCLSSWQIIALIFMLTYTVPFFAFLLIGMRLLKKRDIRLPLFLIGCLLPSPFLLWNLFTFAKMRIEIFKAKGVKPSTTDGRLSIKNMDDISKIDRNASAILQVLQGPYKEEVSTWEAVIILRRLFLHSQKEKLK